MVWIFAVGNTKIWSSLTFSRRRSRSSKSTSMASSTSISSSTGEMIASHSTSWRRSALVSSNNKFTRAATPATNRRPSGSPPTSPSHGEPGSMKNTLVPSATSGAISDSSSCNSRSFLAPAFAAAPEAAPGRSSLAPSEGLVAALVLASSVFSDSIKSAIWVRVSGPGR